MTGLSRQRMPERPGAEGSARWGDNAQPIFSSGITLVRLHVLVAFSPQQQLTGDWIMGLFSAFSAAAIPAIGAKCPQQDRSAQFVRTDPPAGSEPTNTSRAIDMVITRKIMVFL